MASIVKRGNSYSVVYMTTVRGQRKQKWETYHSSEEAERRKQTLDMYYQSKRRKEDHQIETVTQLMEKYVALYGVSKWSASTFQSNSGLIRNYIFPLFGNIRLKELSPLMAAELYRDLLQQPRYEGPYHKNRGQTVSLSVLRDIHKLLHSAFEQAVLWETVDRNPFHRVPFPKMKVKQLAFLRPEQIQHLLSHCDDTWLKLVIHLAFAGTLRKGELLALTWQDVDWENNSIQVSKTLKRVSREALQALGHRDILYEFPPSALAKKTVLVLKQPKTMSSHRKIFLPETVMSLLREYCNLQGKQRAAGSAACPDLIFQYKDGRPLQETTLSKYFKSALQRAGLPQVDFHSLRHSSITYKLILSSGDIKAVQGDSGHAQAEMVTELYAHILGEARKLNAQKFETAFYCNLNTEGQCTQQ